MKIQKIKKEKEFFPKEYRAYGRGIKRIEYANEEGSFLIHTQRPSVMIVPITNARDIILLRKFERGPRRWAWGIPGGGVDAKDRGSFRLAAERELCEEAHVHVKRMKYIGAYFDDVYSTGFSHAFVAEGCRENKMLCKKHHGGGRAEDGDVFEKKFFPLKAFRPLLKKGNIKGVPISDLDVIYRGLDSGGYL